MPEPLTVVLFVVGGALLATLGYAVGRSVGMKEGYERGCSDVSLQVGPYQQVRDSLFGGRSVEAGFTLTICKAGQPVLAPIDTIVVEERKVSRERLAQITAAALGAATATVALAQKGGIGARLIDSPK
jgi:hypothetical protein